VGFDGYPHTVIDHNNQSQNFSNYVYPDTNRLLFFDLDQLDVQGPLLLQGIE